MAQPEIVTALRKSSAVAAFPIDRFREFVRACRVQTKEYGLQPLRLLGSQRYILEQIVDGLAQGITTFVILKARQLGASTFFLALDLFWAFEHAGLAASFATHTDESAQMFRATVDTFFTYLPAKYKIRPKRHNRSLLILANGSMFSYLVAGTKNAKGKVAGLGRSRANNYVHATEVAFWGNEGDIAEFKATMAQHNPHRLQIWESTANGFNHWEEMCSTARESPHMRFIFVGWWRNELFRLERDDPRFPIYYKDAHMTVIERVRVREVKEQHGFDIEPEQLAWYRWVLDDEQKGDQVKMDELYPWTFDDAFQATGSKFFLAQHLTAGMRIAKRTPMTAHRYKLGQQWTDTELEPLRDPKRAELKIYEEPVPEGIYVMGCDPAYGSSDDNDSTAMCIFRCYADILVQVAEYASARTNTYECAWILAHLAGYYRNVRVNLELQGPGQAVQNELQTLRRASANFPRSTDASTSLRNVLGHMQYFLYRRIDTMSGEVLLHTKQTAEIKEYYANAFRDSFHLGRAHIKSMFLLEEMKTIVREDSWVGAQGRKHDDRFIAAILAHQTWKQWEQPKLIALGRTYAKAQLEREKPPTAKRAEAMVLNYLRQAKITLPA